MDASAVRITGPLGPHVSGLWAALATRGYATGSIAHLAQLMAQLSAWMTTQRPFPTTLAQGAVKRFVRWRTAVGYRTDPQGLASVLEYLRGVGVVRPCEARFPGGSPLHTVLAAYATHLVRDRGVSRGTAEAYERVARDFLPANGDVTEVTAERITQFVLAASRRGSIGDTKWKVSALRALLRYLCFSGHLARDLTGAVPAVAGWRLGGLPRDVGPDLLGRVVTGCDGRTLAGRRALAAILLMARLGLRVGEVVALRLEDLEWRSGEVVVRGKGGSVARLPLPADVGRALAAYLQHPGRCGPGRAVFLRLRAPQGPLREGGVQRLLHAACRRAGVPAIGTHRLRHTAATQMLQGGASLAEVGQVLRHRHVETTAIYAKVDRVALRQVVQPWPGGGQ